MGKNASIRNGLNVSNTVSKNQLLHGGGNLPVAPLFHILRSSDT